MAINKIPSKRTALYFPTITIPNGSWLRKTLLYWDEIASIVPQKLDETTMIPFSPDIEFLIDEKVFRPIRPETLEKSTTLKDREQFKQELSEIVGSEQFQTKLGRKQNWQFNSKIHIDKVSDKVFRFLNEKKLMKNHSINERGNTWFLFEDKTALLYMSLFAKYLSDVDSEYTIPSTDREDYRDLIYIPKNEKSSFICTEMLLKNILPVPREDISLLNILDFKQQHRTELLKLRRLVDQFEIKLGSIESKGEISENVVQFTESIQTGVNDLKEILDEARISTIAGSLTTLINVKLPAFWSTVAIGMKNTLGTYDTSIEWEIAGLSIVGTIQIGCHLVNKRNEKRATLRDSAFSYLYHAESLK